MKVVIFNTLYEPNIVGGAEVSVRLLAQGLKEIGCTPVVVTTDTFDHIDYVDDVKVYYTKTNNLYSVYNAKEKSAFIKVLWHTADIYNPLSFKLRGILLREKPDIIHTNNLTGFSVSIWSLAKYYNIPVVHTLRDFYLMCQKSTMFKKSASCTGQCLKCSIMSKAKKIFSDNVDSIVGISKFILNKHLDSGYFGNALIRDVVYNSVRKPTEVKTKFSESFTFGFVGALAKSKGAELLLETFSKIQDSKLKLKLYGKGETQDYEDFLKNKYLYENISFEGFQSHEAIYSSINALIVPSIWNEPFGRIVPEANSYGVPVLASNMGGLPELIEERKNGYIFDPFIENDLLEKISLMYNVYSDRRVEMDMSDFSVANISERYLELYKKTIMDKKQL